MSAILLGDQGVVRFDKMSWWAEGGLVHWRNEDTGQTGTMTVRTCLGRLEGINDMIGNSKKAKESFGLDAVAKHQSYVEQMIVLCERARAQGMPDDPNVLADKVNDLRAKRKARAVVIPGLSARF